VSSKKEKLINAPDCGDGTMPNRDCLSHAMSLLFFWLGLLIASLAYVSGVKLVVAYDSHLKIC